MKQMTARRSFFNHELTTPHIFQFILQITTYQAAMNCP